MPIITVEKLMPLNGQSVPDAWKSAVNSGEFPRIGARLSRTSQVESYRVDPIGDGKVKVTISFRRNDVGESNRRRLPRLV